MSALDELSKMTTVVADTGDIESIKRYTPTDATTNPSLLLKAAQLPQYKALVDSAINWGKENAPSTEQRMPLTLDKIAVNFGKEILKIIPGRVSTEVDARLSFDTEATVSRAESLVQMYKNEGVNQQRILIKIASTWEGIKAAQQLEKKGIHCNLTLMFSLAQAVACAEAGATLISPFVGRILDWYKKAHGVDHYAPHEDPGVSSVTRIYQYYKKFNYKTVVMGASFRNSDEILELAGCDLLTISPALMEELQNSEQTVTQKLSAQSVQTLNIEKITCEEKQFRWMMNQDAMATEKLAEGIRGFTLDTIKLEQYITDQAQHLAA